MSASMDVTSPQTDATRPDSDEHLDPLRAEESPPTATEPVDGPPPGWKRYADRLDAQGVISFLVVAACTYFVFHELNPGGVIFDDTTPTGGDMGAHVWGPAYLRDELIPNFRLSGWTSDWYLGFPAYQFYFVVPALAIVLLNVGLPVVPAVVLIGCAVLLVWRTHRVPELARWRNVAWVGLAVVSVLVIGMPYGVAFKLVAISGLVAMPVCAWALGRLADLPFPGPPLMAAASLLFIFDRSFNITGGNAASTLAGEFSFSIAVCLALLYLGFLIRGLNTGKGRVVAAVLLALTGLCHLIPVFFALGATVVVLFLRMGFNQLRWLLVVGSVGGMLSAFWVLPFAMRQDYLNDMGWEKYDTYLSNLFTRSDLGSDFLRDSPPLEVMVALAAFGLIISLVTRRRLGILLGIWAIGVGVVFYAMGEAWWLFGGDRLWNARLLPFYYLCVYLLAAVGVGEALRILAGLLPRTNRYGDRDRFRTIATNAIPVLGFVLIFLLVAMPLGAVPGGERGDDGVYRWGPLTTRERNFVPGWAEWNFSGYEAKGGNQYGGGYSEYYGIVSTMGELSETYGCGQSMWEFAPELDRYGTTMAMMLIPHWNDG
ncbi:MAG: hypothetical protein IH940_03655 [Acidobacteria bacterium]|nr:hypothetical protein [Acidobacteriota bacterium]